MLFRTVKTQIVKVAIIALAEVTNLHQQKMFIYGESLYKE